MGNSREAILERLPTAEIFFEKDDIYELQAEVYRGGVKMWPKSQGDRVTVIK